MAAAVALSLAGVVVSSVMFPTVRSPDGVHTESVAGSWRKAQGRAMPSADNDRAADVTEPIRAHEVSSDACLGRWLQALTHTGAAVPASGLGLPSCQLHEVNEPTTPGRFTRWLRENRPLLPNAAARSLVAALADHSDLSFGVLDEAVKSQLFLTRSGSVDAAAWQDIVKIAQRSPEVIGALPDSLLAAALITEDPQLPPPAQWISSGYLRTPAAFVLALDLLDTEGLPETRLLELAQQWARGQLSGDRLQAFEGELALQSDNPRHLQFLLRILESGEDQSASWALLTKYAL